MRFSIQRSQIEKIFAQRNGYMMLALASLSVSLVQTLVFFLLLGREKVIIVPPSIEKSFWVTSAHVSPEYLAEMTTFFANLRLNMTPENTLIQRETLLRYVDPIYYSTLKTQLVQESDRMNEEHLTSAFFLVNVKVDAKHLKAMIEGDLKAYVGETSLPVRRVKYLVSYRYDAARLLIQSFVEVKHD